MSKVLLTRRAVVQAIMETEYGASGVFGLNDGVLVSEPTFSVDANMLERDFTRDSLSRTPHIMGRKLAKMEFSTELRGNGKQNSGAAIDAPIIARLFRMCGYKLTPCPTPVVKGVFDIDDHSNRVAWTTDVTAADNTDAFTYYVEVTTAGASGTAKVTITSDIPTEAPATVTMTSGTEIDVGSHGLTITPTFTGDLKLGQKWVLWLLPKGLSLDPLSDDFESGSLRMFKDGVMHEMPGTFGTFKVDAKAGEFAKITWTLTGIWRAPVDMTMPAPNYERTLPSMVELARLRIDGFYAIVEDFTFDQQNDVQVRPDVSSADGYIGTRIVARNPEGGINPEAAKVADNDFWGQMARAERMPFQMRVGHQPGNTVWFLAPGAQYSGLTYQDRNGLLTYDAQLKFPSYVTNDECCWYLC